MLTDRKLSVFLALIILLFFLAPEIFYWVTLDKFQTPLREVSGDSSLYVSQFNAVLQHGQPAGNPYFVENQYQIGRFYIFGTLFSFVPSAVKVPIIWWLIIFKLAVAVLVFYLLARLLIVFNSPTRLAYIFSFIFVLFYGAVTFKGGYAPYTWYLPAWLAGLIFMVEFFKLEKISFRYFLLSLLSLLLFSFYPVYFAVSATFSGLLWLLVLFRNFSLKTAVYFAVWSLAAITLFSLIILPFVYPTDPTFKTMVEGMIFRNTLIYTHFPFLFLFGLRFLILVIVSGLAYWRLAKVENWGRNYLIIFFLSLIIFVGLNSYVVTGKYFQNDHFPFFEEFMVIPLAVMFLFGPSISRTRVTKLLGLAILAVTAASVLVIWNYLHFKPIYFGAEVPQYLAYFIIGLLLVWPGSQKRLFFRHSRFLLKSLLIIAVFHIIFMTFWDDKYWFPLHRQVETYRPLIEIMSELPAGVILANPYISNLALIYGQHKVYWSPIAFHDLVSTEELQQRWLVARTFFPLEPSFDGKQAVVSIFGRRDNKCREFKRGLYLGLLSKIGITGPWKAICYDPIPETKWPELRAWAKAYGQSIQSAKKWQPNFRINYLIVEKGKDQPAKELVNRYFTQLSEDEKFVIFSKNP